MRCKNCSSIFYVKNGFKMNQQDYKFKDCVSDFVFGDQRKNVSIEYKSQAVLLYGCVKPSYGFITQLLIVSRLSVMRLLKQFSATVT